MRIAVCGYGRAGKDTVSQLLVQFMGLKYTQSTSEAAKKYVFQKLQDQYQYPDEEVCFRDRVNHRKEWFDLIIERNGADGIGLYREMAADNEIFNGIRKWDPDIIKCREAGLIDLVIWVDNPRIPPESNLTFGPEQCDITIHNSGTLEELTAKVQNLTKLYWSVFAGRPKGEK